MSSKFCSSFCSWSTPPVRCRLLILSFFFALAPVIAAAYFILVDSGRARPFFSNSQSSSSQIKPDVPPSFRLRLFHGPGSRELQQEGRNSLLGEALQEKDNEFLLLRDYIAHLSSKLCNSAHLVWLTTSLSGPLPFYPQTLQ
ncbi:hypothetical protein LY76DRAFT_326025 [Colletotrichum caudatum]|nr:hypothetical protein LY76DRAFT_326025 [Colletotrichum caudatum]